MDSDEDARTATATATSSSPPDSAAIQESAILNFMSNLSPIKPEKAAPGPPGFPELNSPPNIFRSAHLNPLQETTHLRSQEFSQHAVSGNGIARASEESEKSRIQSSNESLQVRAAGPSGCVHEYFANGVAKDCASADSTYSSLIRCIDMLESLKDCSESTGKICNLDNKIDAEEAGGVPTTRELVKQDLQGNSSSDYKKVETGMKERSSEMPTRVCPGEKLDLSVDHAFQEQRREISVAKNAGVTHKEDLGCTQFPPEALEPIQGYEDDVQNNRGVSKEPIENMIVHNFEGQQHCVMQRQYLQFHEAQGNVVAKNHGYDLSSIEAREAASGMHMNMINFTQPTTSMASSRNIEISKSTVSKPSGIGSYLNTIMPIGCGATGNAISGGDKGCLKMPTRLVSTMGCHQPENTGNIPILLDNRRDFLTRSEVGIHEAPASGLTITLAPQPSQIVKASNDPRFLELGEYQRTQGDKRESMNEHAGAVEESNQSGPIKKRKQATGMSDDDIWKRCNCKKTKCLKLYCDCFAAGIYCSGSCTCQECFNNLDYEDTVLDTRQQIESRNPLAFSPKIEDVNNSTPSLARHKRGCNCRKSTCVKKYCECYQANVGCSDGCRCEGCKNPYGIKEEYGMAKDVPKEGSFPEKSETKLNEKMEMAAAAAATAAGQDSMLASELFNRHNLTHLTPAFQVYDSHMKDTPESRFSNSSSLPSPQSNLPLGPGGRSPILLPKPDNDDMLLLKARRGFQDSVQGLNYSNIETAMDKFSSPRYDLITLPNHPSSPAMAFPDSSKLVDWAATIATASTRLYPGSNHLPSGSSPYWQMPPPTTPPAAALFSERKLTQAVDLITQDGMRKTPNDTSTPSDDEVKADSPSGSRLPDSPA